jgi:hypothetical protein
MVMSTETRIAAPLPRGCSPAQFPIRESPGDLGRAMAVMRPATGPAPFGSRLAVWRRGRGLSRLARASSSPAPNDRDAEPFFRAAAAGGGLPGGG